MLLGYSGIMVVICHHNNRQHVLTTVRILTMYAGWKIAPMQIQKVENNCCQIVAKLKFRFIKPFSFAPHVIPTIRII